MTALQSFLAMGGYARFVWPAYGLAAVVIIGLLVQTLRALRRRERELKQLQDSWGGGRRPWRGAAGEKETPRGGDG